MPFARSPQRRQDCQECATPRKIDFSRDDRAGEVNVFPSPLYYSFFPFFCSLSLSLSLQCFATCLLVHLSASLPPSLNTRPYAYIAHSFDYDVSLAPRKSAHQRHPGLATYRQRLIQVVMPAATQLRNLRVALHESVARVLKDLHPYVSSASATNCRFFQPTLR